MPEVIATYDPGADISIQAGVGLTGGRCVGPPTSRNAGGPAGISDTGDGLLVCGLPAAAGLIFGVASHDALAGQRVDILRAPKVVPIECSAAIAIGAEVQTGTDGRVATFAPGAAARPIGMALSVTSAGGQLCQVSLYSAGSTQNA